MSLLRNLFYYLVILVSALVIFLSLGSLVYDVSYWYSKVLDFPRTQYLIAAVICLPLFALLNRKWKLPAIALTLGLLSAILIQSLDVLPYLVGPKQVADADPAQVTEQNTVGLLLANVLITNKRAGEFLEIVRTRDPDLLLAMEVDDWWMEQLAPLDETYPYTVKQPNDVAYGLALYSKYPLSNTELKYFNQENVPSVHTRVTLPSGREFMLHAMHPVAPVPSKKYPDNKGEKEVAFEKLAEMLAEESLPIIVAGDYNDVSWSHTARLFQDRGKLSNVRLGRGLYNTFDATSPFLRWPLDHYFVSEEFSVVELERLPAFGSDHFPMYANFLLR